MKKKTQNLAISGACLALCMVLPFLTGQIPQIGAALSPMHIPVFLCGMLCGWPYGLVVGFIAPLLRSVLFGMPAIMPNGIAMAFELATYGAVSGILSKIFPQKLFGVYASLIGAMIAGRIVWGIARYAIGLLVGPAFTLEAFLAGAFLNAIPGIILHIVLIPPVVVAVRKAIRQEG